MRALDLVATCAKIMPMGITPYIEGPPGIGKTELAYAIREAMELDWVWMFNAPQHDPVDMVGVPSVKNDMTVWNPPQLLPQNIGRGGVIAIEELAQSVNLMQNAIAPLLLERRIGRMALPDNVFVYATGNRTTDRAGANRILSHVANRVCRLEMEVSPDDWFVWAIKNNINSYVLGFLKFKPNLLHKFDPAQFSNPTPRSWAKVSRVVDAGLDFMHEFGAVAGLVGEGPAVEFKAHREVSSRLPDPELCLAKPKEAPIPKSDEPGVLYSLVYALVGKTTKKNVDNLIIYIDRLPKEYQILSMKELITRDVTFADIKEVGKWMVKNTGVL